MINFLKSFAKGLLYLLVLPALVVGVAIYGVVAIFIFLFLAIKGLILFFRGRSLFDDLPEDTEAKRRLNPQANNPAPATATPSGTEQVSFDTPIMPMNNEEPVSDPSNDPFYVPEYLKPQRAEETVEEQTLPEPEPEPVPQPKVEDNMPLFETEIKDEPSYEEDENIQDEVILEKKPSQNSTILEISDIEDEDQADEKSSGIDIEFH